MSKQITDEISSLSQVTVFNLKNGDITEENSLLVKSTIPWTWHWSPIEGLNSEDSIRNIHHFIRQEIARMSIYPEAGVSPTLRRKKGIVIGVARAVSTELYDIVDDDLIVEEMDTAKLEVGYDGHTVMIKEDVDSKQFLIKAGVGSVAPRLPAIEDEVRKAQTFRTLLATLSPIFDDEVKWEALDEMLSYLENFSAARPTEVVTVHNAPTHLRSIDTREKAVAWIGQWCTQNAEKVAICCGFYMAMYENAGKFFRGPDMRYYHSLNVLKRDKVASYTLGTKLFSDYGVFKAKLHQLMEIPVSHRPLLLILFRLCFLCCVFASIIIDKSSWI